MSTRRQERTLALAITLWLIVLAVTLLAYAYFRGYDDSLCRSYGGTCEWRA